MYYTFYGGLFMQINSYQQHVITPSSVNKAQTSINDSAVKSQPQTVNNNDQVNISSQAQKLAAAETTTSSTQPSIPENSGDKLEQYAEFKKAQMHYQVASDMMNISSGNNNGISAPTAAYLSQNEQAREMALQQQAMQQQYQNMQTYSDQTTQAQNNWVV